MKAVRVIIGIVAVGVAGWFLLQNLRMRETAGMNNRALALIEQKNFAEARDLLEQARRRDAANPSIYKNLGVAYEGLKDVPKAIEAFERSLALKPDQPDVREHVDLLKKGVNMEE